MQIFQGLEFDEEAEIFGFMGSECIKHGGDDCFSICSFSIGSLSSLETLNLNLGNGNPLRNFPKGIPPRPALVELDLIFAALQNVCGQLNSIYFSSPSSCLMTYQNSQESVNFPELSRIQVANNTSDLASIQNILNTFTKSGPGDRLISLELPYVVIKTNQALLDLLTTLKGPPRSSKIEQFKVMIYKLDLETLDSMFGNFIERTKETPRVENVSLSVHIKKAFEKEYSEALSFLCDMFKDLKAFGTFSLY